MNNRIEEKVEAFERDVLGDMTVLNGIHRTALLEYFRTALTTVAQEAREAEQKNVVEQIDDFLRYPLIHTDMRQALNAIKSALQTDDKTQIK